VRILLACLALSYPPSDHLEHAADLITTASGLYYLSELVEEHTVIAKRFITRMVYFIMVVMVLLCAVDRFPVLHTLVGVASHAVYLGNMRRFPFIKWSDPLFLVSCGERCMTHYSRTGARVSSRLVFGSNCISACGI